MVLKFQTIIFRGKAREGNGIFPEEDVEAKIPWFIAVALEAFDEEGTWFSGTRTWELNGAMRCWMCCGVKFCKVTLFPPVVI